tara:strand:+ start:1075 stop:1326 length:252 start_codon:yes stop_codon:yes gene_type:complete
MRKQVEAILADRQELHGDAELNFTMIGRMWGALLQIEDIPPHVVALMYDSGKSVRCMANQDHVDNWLDKLGYTQHGMDMCHES